MDWTYTIGSLTFGLLDIIALVIILIGAVSGCITGFARQVANLAGFVISIPVARPLASVLVKNTSIPLLWSSLIAFVSICLVVFIIVAIFGSMLKRALELVPALDHVLGFVWGLLATAVSLSIIIALLNYQSFFDVSSITSNSVIVSDIIEPLFPALVGVVKGSA